MLPLSHIFEIRCAGKVLFEHYYRTILSLLKIYYFNNQDTEVNFSIFENEKL
jgi:hypothetical protein